MKKKLKKLTPVLFLVLTVIIIIPVSMWLSRYTNHPDSAKNIFDEMYQETQKTYLNNNIFNKLNDAKVHLNQEYNSEAKYPIIIYQESTLRESFKDLKLNFHFIGDEKIVFISFEKEIGKNVRIWIFGRYELNEKKIQKKVQIILENGVSDNYIDSDEEVKSYLNKYDITSKDLDSYYDEIVNQKVLKDWCSIYDSKFSPSNYGEVKVKTQWENW